MKKKHLSEIVLNRILMVIMGSFAALMAVTVLFVYLYAKENTDSLVRFYLDDIKDYATYAMERHMTVDTARFARDFETMASEGPGLFADPDFSEEIRKYFLRCVEYNPLSLDEINLVDENGIIRISTVDKYVGYDMHSGKQSSEFLRLLEGTDIYLQDMQEISYDNKTVMRYAGAALKDTKGFIQVGVGLDSYFLECAEYMALMIRDVRVGRTGYYLLLDKDRKIIGSPRDSHNNDRLDTPVDPEKLAESGKIVRQSVYGVDSYIGTMKFNDDIIVAVYPVAEAWETWNVSMIVLISIYAVVFAILFVLMRRLIEKQVVEGVYSLNDSLAHITDGDLEEKADFRESIEFDELSDGINITVGRLKQLIKEAEERIDEELAVAAKIQTSAIPHKFPAFPGRNEFDLFASMIPAREVGGDFYDFFLVDEDHLALVIADVSGKGIPAAMFMVMAKDEIRHSVQKYGTDVAGAVKEVNSELLKENDAGLFVTLWLGVITVSTGRVDYVDAGHEYPAICRSGRRFIVSEDVHSGPVAALEDMEFDEGRIDLGPGDIIYLYTDGITEANDPDGEMFRIKRMLGALNSDTDAAVKEMDANVRNAVSEFVRGAPQFDDMTTLVFKYKGAW